MSPKKLPRPAPAPRLGWRCPACGWTGIAPASQTVTRREEPEDVDCCPKCGCLAVTKEG